MRVPPFNFYYYLESRICQILVYEEIRGFDWENLPHQFDLSILLPKIMAEEKEGKILVESLIAPIALLSPQCF